MCVSGADKREAVAAILPRGVVSWALESETISLSRAAFVPSTLFLSSMRHYQVLRVLSACCLHVVCMLSVVYFARAPFETHIRSSPVKSGL